MAALGLCLASGLLGAAPAARPEADTKKTEAQLEAVKAEIERITREVSAEQVERDRLTRELKSAELSVGEAREALARGAAPARRRGGAPRRSSPPSSTRARASSAENRTALAGQMRAAYPIGRQEPLKLLLNQKDPALAGRMFAYYSYFGRARAGQIKLIEDDVQRIAELGSELEVRGCQARGAGKAAARAAGDAGDGAREALAGARQPRGAVAQPCAEPRAPQGRAGRAREAAARAARGDGALPGRGERRLHAPARQAQLAGERAA